MSEKRTIGDRIGAATVGRAAEVWRYRYLLRSLIVRDMKVKYKRSTLGFIWTFLNPLLTVAILIAVFRIVIRIPIRNYWAFLISGYFVWNTASQMITAGSFILQEHGRLTRSIAFPKEVILFGAAFSRLIEFAAEMVLILLVLAIAHHGGIPKGFIFLPALTAFMLLLAVGFMLPISTLSTLFTDVQHALPIIMTSLFYLTPVFYPAGMVPEQYRTYYLMNPFAALMTLFRQTLYEGRWPDPALFFYACAASIVVFAVGYAIFDKYKDVCNELL